MTDPRTAAVIAAARRMAAHYRTVFAGMHPDTRNFSPGHRLTVELTAALAAMDGGKDE